jgi:hypothetical protein
MPDGRHTTANDPLKTIRKWVDDIQEHWRAVYVPGSVLVVGASVIGWTGATNIPITYLPNKPTSRGVCLKTIADGHTWVMLGMEFVEQGNEQAQKRYCDSGKSAAVTLRLTEPGHNQSPRIVKADSWFGGLPTSVALLQKRLLQKRQCENTYKAFLQEGALGRCKGGQGKLQTE